MQFHMKDLAIFTLICYIVNVPRGATNRAYVGLTYAIKEVQTMAKMKQQMFLQFNEQEVELSTVEANVKKDWKDAGRKLTEIESLDIYVKPQEGKAYYVVNKEVEGKVDLF